MNLFKKKEKKHPIKGYSYAVTTGTYVGEMLVYVEENIDTFHFISIPKNVNREVPKDKFFLGLESKIVEAVEEIPKAVSELLEKQYNFNKNEAK